MRARPRVEPRRIAVLIDNLGLGGAQKLLEVQVGAMSRTHSILVVNFGPDTPLAEVLSGLGAEVVSNRLSRLADLPGLIRLSREIGRWGPDLIHSHLLYASLAGSLLARWLDLPHVTTLHNERVDSGRMADRVKGGLERRVLRSITDVVVACGPRVAEIQRSRVGRTPMVTVSNRVRTRPPASAEERAARRADAGFGADDLVVLAAGRLHPQKGFDLLIEAFAQVADGRPNLWLLIAGEGHERRRLEERVRRLGLADRVRLVGLVEDVGPLLHVADVFALPSRYEGLPLVLLEAMAAGCPIIATRVGDITSALDEASGLLIRPGEVEPLAAALKRLLGDAALRARLAGAALEASRSYTDLPAFVAELEQVYAMAGQRHAARH